MAEVVGSLAIDEPTAGATDKRADTVTHTTTEGTVEREVVCIGDPDNTRTVNRAAVLDAAPGAVFGLVTRNIPSGTQPVSGTVTADQGSAPWTVRLQDGAGATLGTINSDNQLHVILGAGDGAAGAATITQLYDLDSGAGSEFAQGVQLRAAASGGSVPIDGTAANGLEVDVTRVSGSVSIRALTNADIVTVEQATAASLQAEVQGGDADGGAPTGNPVLVAGWDGVNLQTIQTDNQGVLASLSTTSAADGLNNSSVRRSVANGGATTVPMSAMLSFNGTTWDRLRSTIANGLEVDVTQVQGSVTVDAPVGTPVFVQQSDGAAAIDPRDINNFVGRTIKSAPINVTASGDNAIVAAVGGKRIKVFAINLSVTAAVNAKWRSATTDLTGDNNFEAREGYTLAVTPPAFLFGTAAGEALNLNLSGAVPVDGWVSYWDDDAT